LPGADIMRPPVLSENEPQAKFELRTGGDAQRVCRADEYSESVSAKALSKSANTRQKLDSVL